MLLIWGWVSLSVFNAPLIVQDECHFFDPVYELVDHGKWRGPHNEYLGHGIEQLQYGHPAANGFLQAPWLVVTGSGWEAVRLNAALLRLAIVAWIIYLMYRGQLGAWAALASSLLFVFFSYFDDSVVRPDAGAGLCLVGMLWQLRPRQTLRQTCLMAGLWAAAGLFHQLAIIVGGLGWLCAVVIAMSQGDGRQFRRLSVGAIAAGALFLALYTLPIALMHGASAVPDLYSGTMYHLQVVSQHAAAPFILRQLLWGIPQFTLVLLLVPWLAWRNMDQLHRAVHGCRLRRWISLHCRANKLRHVVLRHSGADGGVSFWSYADAVGGAASARPRRQRASLSSPYWRSWFADTG